MKKILFVFIIILSSCKAIKQFSNQKIEIKKGCMNAKIDKKILLDITLDDKTKSVFLFDTGATLSTLIDSNAVSGFSTKEMSNLGSVKGADGNKIKNRMLTVSMNSPLFDCEDKTLLFINIPKSICDDRKKDYVGVLGMDLFFKEKTALRMDFTNNQLCNIDNSEVEKITQSEGYQLVKSECESNKIYIFIMIQGKEFKFKLDTGYNGSFVMPYSEDLKFDNPNKQELEGSFYKTINGLTKGREILYEKMPISFADYALNGKINVSTSIKSQNVGMEFIKGFDWVIDLVGNKVYVKLNQTKIESEFSRKINYYSSTDDKNNLVVVLKEISQQKFKLRDQIVRVNNQDVTAENICQMNDFLNKTEDWNTLNIEVIPAN